MPVIIARLQRHAVPIVIGVSFFIFGFFVMANVLDLTEREIVVGLCAGGIGGLTMLSVVLWSDRTTALTADPLY